MFVQGFRRSQGLRPRTRKIRPYVIVFALLFTLGLTPIFTHAMVNSPIGNEDTRRDPTHAKRLVLRLRSESATGMSPAENMVPRRGLKGVPPNLKKIHTRWGVKRLTRVRHEADEKEKSISSLGQNRRARRSALSGSIEVQTLRAHFRRTAVVELDAEADLTQALKDYRADPSVEWAEPVRLFHIQGIPNDPSFPSLWGMTKIQTPSAWDLTTGVGVVVAVVDTGVNHTHPDLTANIWANPGEIPNNGIDDDGNGYVDDTRGWNFVSNNNAPNDGHSHGTHVSGIIAAVGNNNVGVIGVAPGSQIMAIKGLGDDGSGYDADLAQGIVYAADNGADVINMSWGGTGDSPVIEEAVQYAHSLGVVLIAAAGNSGIDASLFLPAKYTSVVTVSAFNSVDALASFSNFGQKIDVAAPGVGILSTVPGGFYSSFNGTSMASPHVAGLAALILSRFPTLTNEQVRQALRRTADDVGPSGFDTQSGHGRINALKGVQAAFPPNLLVTSPQQFETVGGSVIVKGSVYGTAIASRQLFYGVGQTPSLFLPVGIPFTDLVTDGPLGTWDVSSLSEGLYTLRLGVTDLAGLLSSYTVSPIRVDHTPPTFLSVTPTDGIALPATPTNISASATDAHGLSHIAFYVNGSLVAVSSPTVPTNTHNATFIWNAGEAGGGAHTLTLTAFDAAGNKASRDRNVTVVLDNVPPTVEITSPAPQSHVSGTVTIDASASDNVTIQNVSFRWDGGSPFAVATTPPYRATLSTLGMALGTHTLTATAQDGAQLQASHSITVSVVTDVTPPVVGPVDVLVTGNNVRLTWSTDEPADSQVEYGTSTALGSFSSLQTEKVLIHQVTLPSLTPQTLYHFRVLSRDTLGNLSPSPLATFQSSDDAPPVSGITEPEEGALVSGTILVSGQASDENTLSRIDLLVDGHYWATVFGAPAPQSYIGSTRAEPPEPVPFVLPLLQTTTWSHALNTSQLNDGTHVLTARSFDEYDHNHDDTRTITVQNGLGTALFDPVLGVPLCSQIGESCSSGGLLEARSVLAQFPEPNHPNTVLGACNDGPSGQYHNDESSDWIQVTSLNGQRMKAGNLVRVDAKVWAYSTKNNYLDLYVTSNTAHPAWKLVATLQPTTTRTVVLSSTFTLPIGGDVHAVRANFRYQGSAGACTDGDYDDHDDLAFAVEAADVAPPPASVAMKLNNFYSQPHPITSGVGTLWVEVDNADQVQLRIYSLNGQLVLDSPPSQAGTSPEGKSGFQFQWDTGEVATGTYYVTVEAEKEEKKASFVRKISVVR